MSYDFRALLGMNESEAHPKKTNSYCPESVIRESFREGGETKRKCFDGGGFSGPRGRSTSDYDDPMEESTLNKVGNGLTEAGNLALQGLTAYKMMSARNPAGKEIEPLGDKLNNKIGQVKNGTTARIAGAVDDNGFKNINSSLNNQAPAIRQPIQKLSPAIDRKISKMKNPALSIEGPAANRQPPSSAQLPLNKAQSITTPQVQSGPVNIELQKRASSPYRKYSADDSMLQPYFDPNSPGINNNDSVISSSHYASGGSINPRIERLVTANEFLREDPRRDREIEEQKEELAKQKQQMQKMQYGY